LNINNFEGDSTNNLIVLDYKSPTPVTKQNFLGHFFYGFSSKDIQHVISDGKLIVKDFEIQTVDEKEIFEFSKKEAEKLWSEMQNFKF
jgi:cytosine/adenosine deaminase-related metal-dependent hydrolase